MTSKSTSLPERFTAIDETNRADHCYLEEADRCLFFGEYFSGQGFQGGATNQLIINFKAPPTATKRQYYKQQAIRTIAIGLRGAITRTDAEVYTWVPIPPSKVKGDPEYDDRGFRTLNMAFRGYDADIRELVLQTKSVNSDHSQDERISPDELYQILRIDSSSLSEPIRSRGIILFDDVLTTGKHFKCCSRRIVEALPDAKIAGIFVARCIRPNPFDDFDEVHL